MGLIVDSDVIYLFFSPNTMRYFVIFVEIHGPSYYLIIAKTPSYLEPSYVANAVRASVCDNVLVSHLFCLFWYIIKHITMMLNFCAKIKNPIANQPYKIEP